MWKKMSLENVLQKKIREYRYRNLVKKAVAERDILLISRLAKDTSPPKNGPNFKMDLFCLPTFNNELSAILPSPCPGVAQWAKLVVFQRGNVPPATQNTHSCKKTNTSENTNHTVAQNRHFYNVAE